MSDYKLKSAAAALVACAAWTSVSIASEDGGGPGEECSPPQYCWEQFICEGLLFCYDYAGMDDEDRDNCFGEFPSDPISNGGNGYAGMYQACMQNACEDGWRVGGGENQVATAPTMPTRSPAATVTSRSRWVGPRPSG